VAANDATVSGIDIAAAWRNGNIGSVKAATLVSCKIISKAKSSESVWQWREDKRADDINNQWRNAAYINQQWRRAARVK